MKIDSTMAERPEPDRHRQPVGDQLGDGEILGLVGRPEIAVRQLAEIDEILLVDGLIEVIGRLDIVLDLGGQAALAVERGRPAPGAS